MEHGKACSESGKNEILWAEILMGIDLKLVFRCEPFVADGRRQQGNDARPALARNRRLL